VSRGPVDREVIDRSVEKDVNHAKLKLANGLSGPSLSGSENEGPRVFPTNNLSKVSPELPPLLKSDI
jgi:hypothetical protein